MKNDDGAGKAIALHAGVIAVLVALNFVLPDYHHGVMARVLVLAVYAMGYNLLFGYAGLLSLGHAMFFAAGLYGAGLTMYHLDWGVPEAFLTGLVAAIVVTRVFRLPARHDLPADRVPAWVAEVEAEMVVAPMDWGMLAAHGAEWMGYWDRHVRGSGRGGR